MSLTPTELGVAQVLLERLNEIVLPRAFELQSRVERGELLGDLDRAFLAELASEQRRIPALIAKQPQFGPLAREVAALIESVARRARENEEAQSRVLTDPRVGAGHR